MPKGHSTLEPQVKAVIEQNADLARRIAALEGALEIQQQHSLSVNALIDKMMESFKNGNIPLQMANNYKSNFTQWPNGS
jgi:hypothetical protein